jgi:hypothetical protein
VKVQATGEHELEPVHGLPEPLPPGERILWQGTPAWRTLARRAFHTRKLALYFGVLLALRAGFVLSDGGTAVDAVIAVLWLLPAVAIALGTLTLMAWLIGRTTVYTITNARVVMRIGVVLSITLNLPFRTIQSAGLRTYPDGTGDLPLTIGTADRIAYAHLWPHARPWRYARTEPMLRSIPDAARVAGVLSSALAALTPEARPVSAAEPAPVRAADLPSRVAEPRALATAL